MLRVNNFLFEIYVNHQMTYRAKPLLEVFLKKERNRKVDFDLRKMVKYKVQTFFPYKKLIVFYLERSSRRLFKMNPINVTGMPRHELKKLRKILDRHLDKRTVYQTEIRIQEVTDSRIYA